MEIIQPDTPKISNFSKMLQQNWMKIALGLFIVLTVIFGIATLLLTSSNKIVPSTNNSAINSLSKNAISGSINFNGVAPDGATIAIAERKVGDSQFNTVASGIAPVDGAVWSWNGGKNGVAYELQAYLQRGGQNIAQSSSLIVVAPADSEILSINSNAVVSGNQTAVISGSVDLNGYIPSNSTIKIVARKTGDANFTPIVANLTATDGIVWNWANALNGTSYDVQGYLINSNGANIGQSQIQTFTAPAYNEVIRINSTAQSPVSGFVSISGSINHNGNIPSNSSYSIATRQTGTTQFNTVITGIPVADSATWIWNQAKSGVTYDVQAYLITNGNTITSSQILTVAAPAVNEVLTINAQNQPPAPSANSMTNTCLGQNSSGQWQVKITFNNNTAISNAQQYQLTIGTSSQDSSIVNSVTTPSNPNSSQTYTTNYVINTGTTYYAQWAYSTCTSCNTFSSFSPSLQFYCNVQPTPTNTPTSVPTTAPTSTSTPTPSPSLTLAPTSTSTPTVTPSPTDTPVPPTNGPPAN